MKLTFHGANRSVTGSCHLVSVAGLRILVDCGLFQGGREIAEENAADFGFDPSSIDVLLLTHAHLDHCGRLPLLVKRGFCGEIVATAATCELARVVLLDSAHLQEEEAKRDARKARRRAVDEPEPLYTRLDALNAMGLFGRKAAYGEVLSLSESVSATFYDAGHILGSASIRLEHRRSGSSQSIVLSGDLGSNGRPIIRDPQAPPAADAVVMETTYGDRLHKPLEPSVRELWDAVRDTIARGGNVIIPTFALERAQEILYFLREGIDKGVLPRSLPVYLDSPMAISATEIFRRHPECFDAETKALFGRGEDPFAMPGLRFTRDAVESMALNALAGGAVILAGAGMCTGGRVRHHLRHTLWRKDSSIVFVGFAAPGTLARILIDGAEQVRLFGEEISVRARRYTINGLSAHADRDELIAWHRALKPRRTILVHGEESAMRAFAEQLRDTEVDMPRTGQSLIL